MLYRNIYYINCIGNCFITYICITKLLIQINMYKKININVYITIRKIKTEHETLEDSFFID